MKMQLIHCCCLTRQSTHCFSSTTGIWDSEVSACVNEEVDSVLQMANVSQTLQSQSDDKTRSSFSRGTNPTSRPRQPISYASNLKLCLLLQIADSGLGSLQKNAAHVFSRLKAVTNDSQTIKTFSNLNTSVQVLFTMCKKGNLHSNESTADVSVTEDVFHVTDGILYDFHKVKHNSR